MPSPYPAPHRASRSVFKLNKQTDKRKGHLIYDFTSTHP